MSIETELEAHNQPVNSSTVKAAKRIAVSLLSTAQRDMLEVNKRELKEIRRAARAQDRKESAAYRVALRCAYRTDADVYGLVWAKAASVPVLAVVATEPPCILSSIRDNIKYTYLAKQRITPDTNWIEYIP